MKVLVTDPIDDAGLDRLREAGHDVQTAYEIEGDALREAVADANATVVRSGTEAAEPVFAAAGAPPTPPRASIRAGPSHLAQVGGSSLTDDGMRVADADTDSDEIPSSYVPFRNANLLSMAVSYAEASCCEAVFIGAHSEDFSGYPDCRPAFFEAFQGMVDVGTKPGTDIELAAPFVEWSKTDIAERGLELGVPYADTWSCYRSDEPACGTCDACAFRLQAFRNLGERDPSSYERRPRDAD